MLNYEIVFLYFPDDLKARYKALYQKNQIHVVDKDSRILLKEVNIDDFAVKLKICNDLPSAGNFRDEARQHLQNFRNVTGDDIMLTQLIDRDNRVTFIRGIAGMGKTVLSKQLTNAWAHERLYNEIDVCITFECREINVFQATRGAHLKKYELLEEFVKTKFRYDLGDGQGILFVVDGLDELFDISTDTSIIKQLLNRSIYPASKVIITGRPHVERKLEEFDEVGGLRKVEIQGLSDEQIMEYVDKFPFPEGVHLDLNNAKDSTKRFLPIVHIPQFLNTFCCIASTWKGEAMHCRAELYCWTIYLLLKQHADKQDSSKVKLVSDVFIEYSKELLTLGKVCHKLLTDNKLIILKKDIELLLDESGKGKEFVDSLFVDVSDNFSVKFQFKHLTLMEFLSAFYICSMQNRIEVIKENLKKGFLEVAMFACQLISGLSYKGIIRDMLNVCAADLDQVSGRHFCCDVVKVLQECGLDEKTTFICSLDIIFSSIDKDFCNGEILLSTVRMLHSDNVQTLGFKGLDVDVEKSRKLHNIYEHLLNNCKCSEDDMQAAFENVHVNWFNVDRLETVQCVKYFGYVHGIGFNDMKLNVNAARHEVEALGPGICRRVAMFKCELEDNEVDNRSSISGLNGLGIWECKLNNVSSLINAFHWSTSSSSFSCQWFLLWRLEFKDGWWDELVAAIEKKMNANGYVSLGMLDVRKCTLQMCKELQMRVGRFLL